jgi:type III restriction enzyme
MRPRPVETQSQCTIETKATKDVETPDVKSKESAARRWARYVSDDPALGVEWGYLLLSEDDIEAARGSWPALRKLETGS